jgi:RNA polymerase sigma factor (sigma-70 family)
MTDDGEPSQMLEKEESLRMVGEGIGRLPSKEKLLMRLHFEKGLSLEEIADVMHLSLQNAYTIKHRAVKRLRSWINQG